MIYFVWYLVIIGFLAHVFLAYVLIRYRKGAVT